MNSFKRKMQTRLALHPQTWKSIFAIPTEESLQMIIDFNLLDTPNIRLAPLISSFIPLWEHQACEGNEVLVNLIRLIEKAEISPYESEDQVIRSNLQRIRIFAATPGLFPFSPIYIQEQLTRFLESSESLADLPEFYAISFSKEEIIPLALDLMNYRLHPHSRRYIQNLLHLERRESILSVLAYIAKNYPLLGTCRQAYALMLSLDNPDVWSSHPFPLRLIANRFWEFRMDEESGKAESETFSEN